MVTLRRSILFLPGNNERFLVRAIESAADALILDIEDAVMPDQKPEAREMVKRALQTEDFRGKERVVRVNGITTQWGADDMAAAVEGGADLILVPKADSEEVIKTADRIITEAEKRFGMPEGSTKIMALIETALGMINVERTVFASPRIDALAFGGGDYGLSTRVRVTPDEIAYIYPESKIMLAARAAGVMAIGTPYAQNIRDLDAVARQAKRQRDLGLDGKTVIHPTHVDIANAAFTPSAEEIAFAQKVITAYEASDRGAISVDGKLIEHLHVSEARWALDVARQAGMIQ
jgi:citrate lyase subunit beta/citryl-CoA lyase